MIALARQIDLSLDLLERNIPAQSTPVWRGIVARRRRAAIILREQMPGTALAILRRLESEEAAWQLIIRRKLRKRGPTVARVIPDLRSSDAALLAQFDGLLVRPDLPLPLRHVLGDLRAEVEQARLTATCLPLLPAGPAELEPATVKPGFGQRLMRCVVGPVTGPTRLSLPLARPLHTALQALRR